MTGNIVFGVLVLVVSVVFFMLATAFYNDSDNNWGSGFMVAGICFFVGGVLSLLYTPIEYYEKRIPTLKEQVLEYEKVQIEIELKGLEND
jgi:hypothetical protein